MLVDPGSVRIDPKNSNYTRPRTWGVYKIISDDNTGKKFRYGNHPIRHKELEGEFGSIKLTALYDTREEAEQRANMENIQDSGFRLDGIVKTRFSNMERNILINKTINKPGNYLSPLYLKYFLQVSFALFYIYSGFRFILFLNWATGKSEIMVDKPGAVEGFLPISALLGLKQLLQTGKWDWVHPAGLTIFIAILVISFLFRKGFCAYICPVGFISNLLAILGRKLSLSLVPHKWTGYLLTSIKYLLLGFFLYTITILMDASSVQSFIQSPYNMTADARMLNFFTHPSSFSLSIFAMIFILSVIMRNFWCRYLCPYGALLGLFSFMSPIAIKRDDELCTNCRQCSDRCPAGIKIHTQTNVRSPECIGCGDCIHHCPEKSCLSFTIFSKWPVHWSTAGIGSVAMLLVFYTWAILTKHWHTPLPPVMLQRIYGL